jgi:hypothetical protein
VIRSKPEAVSWSDDPAHPDPASYQAERRALQLAYRDKRRNEQRRPELKIERLRDELALRAWNGLKPRAKKSAASFKEYWARAALACLPCFLRRGKSAQIDRLEAYPTLAIPLGGTPSRSSCAPHRGLERYAGLRLFATLVPQPVLAGRLANGSAPRRSRVAQASGRRRCRRRAG